MTKVIFVSLFILVAMIGLLMIMNILTYSTFRGSLETVLNPYKATDPGEFTILLIFATGIVIIPLIQFIKIIKKKYN